LNDVGENGNYWSSSPNSATNGYNLNFNGTNVNPANNNDDRQNGFPVRCVAAFIAIFRMETDCIICKYENEE
jgi:uncharacterized protein (TIGR02145 family)